MRISTAQIALIASTVFCAGAFGVFWYGLHIVGQKTGAVAQLSEQISQEQMKVDHFQAVRRLASTTVESRTRLNKAFLRSEEVASFATYLERLAASTGASAKITSYTASANGDGVFNTENLNATLNITGSWSEVSNAVRMLEHIPYVSAIDAISYSKGASEVAGKSNSGALWTANVSLRVVKYKQ